MIAPYRGLAKTMVRFVMTPGNFTDQEFYFRRVRDTNTTARILHINFRGRQLATVLSDEDLLKGR